MAWIGIILFPSENLASVFREFFPNLTEVKKRSNYKSSVHIHKCQELKFFFCFLSPAFAELFLPKKAPHLRKTEDFVARKSSAFFLKNHSINYRYDRRYAEDLRPPHFRQTNSNYGSLSYITHSWTKILP